MCVFLLNFFQWIYWLLICLVAYFSFSGLSWFSVIYFSCLSLINFADGSKLQELALSLSLRCLSFDFMGTSIDESADELGTVQVRLLLSWKMHWSLLKIWSKKTWCWWICRSEKPLRKSPPLKKKNPIIQSNPSVTYITPNWWTQLRSRDHFL